MVHTIRRSHCEMRSYKETIFLVLIILLLVYGFFYHRQSLFQPADGQIPEDGMLSTNVTLSTPLTTTTTAPIPSPTPGINPPPSSTYPSKVSVTPFGITKTTLGSPVKSTSSCNPWLTGRKPNDGRWYNFSTPKLTIYAYTAFIDDRPSLKTDPVVRIIALADILEVMTIKPRMVCRFYYPSDSKGESIRPQGKIPLNSTSSETNGNATFTTDVEMEMNPIRKIGMGWPLNSKSAREYIFTCPLPKSKQLTLPLSLGILVGESSQNHAEVTACLPIERPPKPEVKKDFVLCVQVAFGQLNPMRLIEWLELQILLGVQSIGLYDHRVHEPAMVVLRHYAKLGYVDLRKSDYIPDGDQQYFLHGSPVINDCMYRNMHAFKYMLVYDVDEVILPKITNLSDATGRTPFKMLMDNMEKKYGKGPFQYMFRNSYFFFNFPNDTKEPKEFVFLSHKYTAPISDFGYSTKSIIDQTTCIQMHNHWCWGTTKEHDQIATIDVDLKLGKNHHYKQCHFTEPVCTDMLSKGTIDDSIMVYKEELMKRVKSRVEEIRTELKKIHINDFLADSFKGS